MKKLEWEFQNYYLDGYKMFRSNTDNFIISLLLHNVDKHIEAKVTVVHPIEGTILITDFNASSEKEAKDNAINYIVDASRKKFEEVMILANNIFSIIYNLNKDEVPNNGD